MVVSVGRGTGRFVMAQKLLVRYIDDLDGTEADTVETVQFSLDGVSYEIDLSDANSGRLRDSLAAFVQHGRRIGGRARRGQSVAAVSGRSRADTEAIREWARSNGHQISDRGRIPARVLDAYAAVS